MNKREELQQQAKEEYINHGKSGTIVAWMGFGKSKVAIEIAEELFPNGNILVTSPRTNLTKSDGENSWTQQLEKHGKLDTQNWKFVNIQTAYKWNIKEIGQFDFIIVDEIHTILTPEYAELLKKAKGLGIRVLGLTGTPDIDGTGKLYMYYTYAPIIFEYYNSSKDGIINKSRLLVYNYDLTDEYKVLVGSKKKSFKKGEATQYNYLTNRFEKARASMLEQGSEYLEVWNDAVEWTKNKEKYSKEQYSAGLEFIKSISMRKKFLHTLDSSKNIAIKLKNKILENPENKVLIFSELTEQIEKITPYVYHSKQDQEINDANLEKFNKGEIRELGSIRSLMLGLNLTGANYLIFESYVGAKTPNAQKVGRGNRLDPNEIATNIILKPNQSQTSIWFKKMVGGLNVDEVVNFNNLDRLMEAI